MCQGCHLHYDRDHHAQTARVTRRSRLAANDLFDRPDLRAYDEQKAKDLSDHVIQSNPGDGV
jgi:hypothetical protein